jgi:hypothetical protein
MSISPLTKLSGKKVYELFNRNPAPLNKKEFGEWLSGFIDGEGCFSIYFDKNYIKVSFTINLHVDDSTILYKIKDYFKVGSVYTTEVKTPTKSGILRVYTTFQISSRNQLMVSVIPLREVYKLKTKKYLDFEDFKTIVQFMNENGSNFSKYSEKDQKWVRNVISKMNSRRQDFSTEIPHSQDRSLLWLQGFVEGGGTFGTKSLVPYFSVGQHNKSAGVRFSIWKYLSDLPNNIKITKGNPTLKPNLYTNKTTDVVVLSVASVDSLFDVLAPLFLTYEFPTRKGVDFQFWCLRLFCHKFGYFYLPKGRELCVAISQFINCSRYSTALTVAKEPEVNFDRFKETLPIVPSEKWTHTTLAQAFAKLKKAEGKREIWVSKNGIILEGSPFKSNNKAQLAIGLKSTSSTVKRYLDTGKLYKGEYLFWSSLAPI